MKRIFPEPKIPRSPPSAEKLRPKTGKTMVAQSAAGHSKFLQKGGSVQRRGKKVAAQVLPVLQREGPVRQRSLSADLNFCFFFFKKKEGHSGSDTTTH